MALDRGTRTGVQCYIVLEVSNFWGSGHMSVRPYVINATFYNIFDSAQLEHKVLYIQPNLNSVSTLEVDIE
jgi:hypothetical protein